MNRRAHKALQLAKWFAVFAVSLVITIIAAIQFDQRLMRRDAEALLSALRKLEVGVTTQDEAQAILRRWPEVAKLEGNCQKSCWITMTVNSFSRKHNDFFVRHRRLLSLYDMFGGHLAEVRAAAEFASGTFRADTVGFYIYVAPDKTTSWADYTLIGGAGIEPESSRPSWPHHPVRDPLHPTYFLRAGGGCEVCIVINVTFMPGVNSFDRNRLMQFDFSCLTRWLHPCRTQADIMPPAWKQFLRDQAQP